MCSMQEQLLVDDYIVSGSQTYGLARRLAAPTVPSKPVLEVSHKEKTKKVRLCPMLRKEGGGAPLSNPHQPSLLL